MSEGTNRLITALAADLKPVRRPGRVGHLAAVWFAVAGLYSWLTVVALGPLRDGAVAALLAQPLFGVEALLGLATVAALAWAGLRTSIPGESNAAILAWPLTLGLAWLALYVMAFWYPTHPVSMAGKRDHCVWEAFLISLPSLLGLLWFARRLLPLWPRSTGALAGAAAAAFPAGIMQLACMYSPDHGLIYHIGPIAFAVAFGAVIGRLALSRAPVRTLP